MDGVHRGCVEQEMLAQHVEPVVRAEGEGLVRGHEVCRRVARARRCGWRNGRVGGQDMARKLRVPVIGNLSTCVDQVLKEWLPPVVGTGTDRPAFSCGPALPPSEPS
ncbi:hypothetical protein GCM10008961_30150 [Deinococcus knuensis]|uniref:Uncharacterized protein n=1 Tax=Deinococcus knuensis TaxID=1837380 RepID=A0ABQ2SQ11_9DEIO|nr:hypothetical protein GCM10008961_30150 [Deinococcus knuensis]